LRCRDLIEGKQVRNVTDLNEGNMIEQLVLDTLADRDNQGCTAGAAGRVS